MNMSFRIDRLDLLESAEAAAHTGGHDHEGRILLAHFFLASRSIFLRVSILASVAAEGNPFCRFV